MQTQSQPEMKAKLSPKLQFLLNNFQRISQLEISFKKLLSEAEIKKNPYLVIKVCEGGWLPFKEVHKLQKLFEDEKSFFQSLCLIKRIEICQIDSKTKQNSSENLVIKLNESFGNPQLNFTLKKQGKDGEVEKTLHELVKHSVFKDHIDFFEITNQSELELADKDNLKRDVGKIRSDLSCVISGLKCFFEEFASDLVCNLSEDFFNLDAKPFVPKSVKNQSIQNDLASLSLQKKESTKSNQAPVDPVQQQLDKKRQISQMYQYYNYLIFEKNKESFNDINPDLRKMTYKYDSEVKNAYMTVQASPEVIKAAMGMNIANHNPINKEDQKENQGPPAGAAAKEALNLEKKDSSKKKTIRYSKDAILQIYRGMGQFKSPLIDADPKVKKYLEILLNEAPNVVLPSLKDLPPAQADKSQILSSVIDNDLAKLTSKV